MRRIIYFLAFALIALPCCTTPSLAEDTVITLWRGDHAIFQVEDLLKQKKFAESLDISDKIVKRNIRNADAHVYQAMAYFNLGNIEKAKASITNAMAIDRGHMGAYVMAGIIALKEEDRGQAEYYLNALRIICQSETCAEYTTLNKAILEYKDKE